MKKAKGKGETRREHYKTERKKTSKGQSQNVDDPVD